MKYFLAFYLALAVQTFYCSNAAQKESQDSFVLVENSNRLEKELVAASCRCDWPVFKALVKALPANATHKAVVLPNAETVLTRYGQHSPDLDATYTRFSESWISKFVSIQSIVAMKCPVRFLQLALERSGSIAAGSYSLSSRYSMLSLYDAGYRRESYNAKPLSSIARRSAVQSQEKVRLIDEQAQK